MLLSKEGLSIRQGTWGGGLKLMKEACVMSSKVRGFVETNETTNTIDVSKLKEGMVFENYSDFTKCMGIKKYKPKSNSQNAQFKELSSLCEWERGVVVNGKNKKNAIVILKVFDEKKTVIDRRTVTKESKLSRLVSKSILDMIKRVQTNEDTQFGIASSFYISERDLRNELGFKNSSYDQCKRLKEALSNYLSIPLVQVEDFFELTDDVITKTIKSACKKLEQQRCVITNKTKQLVLEGEELDNGVHLASPIIYATDEQYKFIFAAEGVILSKYGLRTVIQVHKKDELFRNRFYEDVIELIRNTAPSSTPELAQLKRLKFYCSAFEMCYFEERVNKVIELNGSLTNEERIELGDFVLEQFVKNLEVSLKSSIEDINKEMTKRSKINASRNHTVALKDDSRPECRRDDEYTDNMITLINALIDKTNPVNINALKTGKSK